MEVTVTDGIYNDQFDNSPSGIKTSRLDLTTQVGSAFFPVGPNSDVTATATLRQDAYGTGDLLGTVGEDVSVRTLFGTHADNTLSYNSMSVRGYTPMPSFDSAFGTDQLGEELNVYNGSKYHFSATTSYDFHEKFLSPVAYDLLWQPTPLSSVSLGTTYDPHGIEGVQRPGYSPLNISLATPDRHGRLLPDAVQLRFQTARPAEPVVFPYAHGQQLLSDPRGVSPAVERSGLLGRISCAFPSQSVNFGINSNGPIIAQSFGQ